MRIILALFITHACAGNPARAESVLEGYQKMEEFEMETYELCGAYFFDDKWAESVCKADSMKKLARIRAGIKRNQLKK